jgi:heptosyltransferase-2
MSVERRLRKILVVILRRVLSSRRAVFLTHADIRKIFVIRQHNQLGDMLCVVPLLRALKSKFPAAEVSLLASPVNAEVMFNNRYLNDVIVYDKREMLGKISLRVSKLLSFVRHLRSRRFDVVLVPSTVSTSFTSDLFAYLSGASVRIGASSIDGKDNPSGFFFTSAVTLDWRNTPHRHQTLRNLDIARELGAYTDDLTIEMSLTVQEREKGKAFVGKALGQKAVGIGFHPGAGKVPNRWPASRFADAANALAREFDARVFVTFGQMDDVPVQEMLSQLTVGCEVIKFMPVRIVASILAHLQLVITNDTGVMHVAAAVGVPVLSLFGPTDAEQWAPIGQDFRYISGSGGNIANIGVEEVLQKAREMLRARAT